MNAYQWITIGVFLALVVVMIIFRKTVWVQKTWKILAVIIPPILVIVLAALRSKPAPTPVPASTTPAPIPIPEPGTTPAPVTTTPAPSIIITVDYQISAHFNFGMLTKTENRKFIDMNRKEGQLHLKSMADLCNQVLEPVWSLVGPVSINSCFRCQGLNIAVGGSESSQHMDAEAADTEYAGVPLKSAFNKIAFSNIKFSQVILEFNQWIHVGVIDEVLHPGKKGQRLIATRELYKIDEKGYDPANPNKTHVVYTAVTKPI